MTKKKQDRPAIELPVPPPGSGSIEGRYAAIERGRWALRQRQAGYSYKEIGRAMGISFYGARGCVWRGEHADEMLQDLEIRKARREFRLMGLREDMKLRADLTLLRAQTAVAKLLKRWGAQIITDEIRALVRELDGEKA